MGRPPSVSVALLDITHAPRCQKGLACRARVEEGFDHGIRDRVAHQLELSLHSCDGHSGVQHDVFVGFTGSCQAQASRWRESKSVLKHQMARKWRAAATEVGM